MQDISKELLNFNGKQTQDNINQFFNPNICHVCKSRYGGYLITCSKCELISYCCERHRQDHKVSHLPLCLIARRIIQSKGAKWKSQRFTTEEWKISQRTLMQTIQTAYKDFLKPYEVEMFMCAKSCLICHQQDNLQACKICYSVNYCAKHKVDFEEKHKENCKNLLVLLNLNILTMDGKINVQYPDRMKSMEVRSSQFNDMFDFVNTYIMEYFHQNNTIWVWQSYVYSDYVSNPLTFYYYLKISSAHTVMRPDYHIHIIAASFMDIESLPSWELFLHIFTQIRRLNITLIIPKASYKESVSHKLCYGCREKNRNLFIRKMSKIQYKQYVREKLYENADVMIAYEAEFNVGDPLFKIFELSLDRGCPFIFTAKSQCKAEEIIHQIRGNIDLRTIFKFIENKFRGYRPHRYYETGGIYYRNSYLVV